MPKVKQRRIKSKLKVDVKDKLLWAKEQQQQVQGYNCIALPYLPFSLKHALVVPLVARRLSCDRMSVFW